MILVNFADELLVGHGIIQNNCIDVEASSPVSTYSALVKKKRLGGQHKSDFSQTNPLGSQSLAG